jgi:hypothetical protein
MQQNQLAVVVTAFTQWRKNRKGRHVSTPISLREQAVSLLNTYSSSKIIAALHISGSQLKQWREHDTSSTALSPFVSLPMAALAPQQPFNIELRFVSGEQLRLSGVVEHELLTTLIAAIKS